ncbi:GntR family transcriptional regulator [Sphingomonas gilva]|uniref:GntR family transcriptional regulator n=1 Tax=Sphingomonas gilva TaxID=2305907 RepID=A0A396RL50_9SPHN|nr:GntR family transcriptional regulator [Sphingomonas gilva]RHW16849.1 GntR family transcriptional regulator [Sphingomonas gilva]
MGEADPAPNGAKYMILADKLRGRLEAGEFEVGAQLPTEDDLCDAYKVSRYTIREALRVLEGQGYIQRKRRAGTRVLSHAPVTVYRHVTSSASDLLHYVRETTVAFEKPIRTQADRALARLLGCEELRQWYLLKGVRIGVADNRPVGAVQVYVDAHRIALPDKADFGGRPVYQWLAETYNIRASAVSQDISAVTLSREEAGMLHDREAAPALRIVRRYFDEQDRIFQISVTTHRSEDFVYNTLFRLEI